MFKVNILQSIKGARLASSDVYFSFRVWPLTIFNSIEDYQFLKSDISIHEHKNAKHVKVEYMAPLTF